MLYFVKTPKWLRKLYGGCIWQMPDNGNTLYLSFDDGPHPLITPFVLDQLKKYDARATFFCVGKNVAEYPEVYKRILDEGHAVGNHTHDHLDGWKTDKAVYLANIQEAGKYIHSDLFRPPYGRITRSQQKEVISLMHPFKVVMWSVLSGDFDINISPEQCYKNVIYNAKNGSVVVFHDSEKADLRMRYALPLVLKHFFSQGYLFKKIDLGE